ncbi:hypothetical protein BASA61_001951 [Batrachochytrium salamandrivorans]|nr:hypothetical protein BASA61_001951 [Batrachochytrium salamandrivorans]
MIACGGDLIALALIIYWQVVVQSRRGMLPNAWHVPRDTLVDPLIPIRNEEGVLQFQPISICNTLRSHYMRLAEAGEGHSLDPTHWETMPQPPQHIPPSSTLSMDLPFSLRELDHALGSMHPRKAPGDDGITTALMQAIAHDPKDHGTGDVNLDRPASNLRGISLINVGLKILCKMVQARLSSLLESNNVLVPEQGGFRTREESTAQVCALMDILRRRQIADLNSHIAFIDISKAFDTVPIHALLFKLRCIGIPTITMNFSVCPIFHFQCTH